MSKIEYRSKCQLIHGDCLEEMPQLIADGLKVDLVLTDLPYNITSCDWDNIIPFEPMWNCVNQLTNEDTPSVFFGAEPFSSYLRLSNIKNYKYDWIWKKPRGTGHLNAMKQPLRDVEQIIVFYNKQCRYNPQYSKGEPYSSLKGGKTSKVSQKGDTVYGKFNNGAEFRNDNPGIRYPKQVLHFGVVERDTFHPTQKPVKMLEYLIKTYTNEGDTVLDFTMGSGSTGVACLETGRNFIGIELDKEYYDIAVERCKSYQSNLEAYL